MVPEMEAFGKQYGFAAVFVLLFDRGFAAPPPGAGERPVFGRKPSSHHVISYAPKANTQRRGLMQLRMMVSGRGGGRHKTMHMLPCVGLMGSAPKVISLL